MKIEGVKLGIPSTKLIVFPRLDPETNEEFEIAFECKAVLDYEEFEKLVPEPKPGQILRPGQKEPENDYEAKEYVQAVARQSTLRMDFMVLKSLEVNSGLTWEKVKLKNPDTWELWRVEMHEAGFNEVEINRLHVAVIQVNSLDEDTLEEAKESFLRRRAAAISE